MTSPPSPPPPPPNRRRRRRRRGRAGAPGRRPRGLRSVPCVARGVAVPSSVPFSGGAPVGSFESSGRAAADSAATSSSKSRSIAARSADAAGDQLEGVGGLVHGHPGAAQHRAPGRACAARAARSRAAGRRCRPPTGRAAAAARAPASPGCAAMPIGLALTRPAAAGHRLRESVRGRRHELHLRARGRCRVAARPEARVRVGVDDEEPAARRALPGRGRRRCRRRPRPRGRPGRGPTSGSLSTNDRRKPLTSVLCPTVRPSRISTVLSAPIAADLGATSSTSGTIACLAGWVTLSPSKPSSTAPASSRVRRLRVDGAVGLVDDLVDVAQALPLGLALVQLGRQRRADAVADQPAEPGPLARRAGHRPSLSGR